MPLALEERVLLRSAAAESDHGNAETVEVRQCRRPHAFAALASALVGFLIILSVSVTGIGGAGSRLKMADSENSAERNNKYMIHIPPRPPQHDNVSGMVTIQKPPVFRGIYHPPTIAPFRFPTRTTTTRTLTTTTQTTSTQTTTTTTLRIWAPEAPLHEFYMYRAIAEGGLDKYPFGNINTGNLDGVMWYLMNEVVTMYTNGSRCPRKFNISKIHRFKVITRATRELFSDRLNMGARFSFDRGSCTGRCFPQNMCTGKEDCDYHYGKYGFVVGCNNFYDHNPFPDMETPAPGGIWYSLPLAGRCNFPTGAHDCTWSYQDAGEIDLKELEATEPGWGDGNCCNGTCTRFWDDQFNVWRTSMRVQKALDMFQMKYPDQPTILSTPVCDFHPSSWYKEDNWTRRDPWSLVKKSNEPNKPDEKNKPHQKGLFKILVNSRPNTPVHSR